MVLPGMQLLVLMSPGELGVRMGHGVGVLV